MANLKRIPDGMVELVRLSALVEAERNPNRMPDHEYRALVANIQAEGFLQPLLLVPAKERGKLQIVDGHHRVRAALEVGLTHAPAVVAKGKTAAQVEALRLAMNRIRGQADLAVVEEILRELEDGGWALEDLERTGYSTAEIQVLLSSLDALGPDSMAPPPVSARGGGDEVPAAPKPWVLELRFGNREDYQRARRALKKAAGKSKDPARGLLALLGTAKKGERT